MIGTLQVIVDDDNCKRFLIHLNKPDIGLLNRIRNDKAVKNLSLGKYNITKEFTYERI